ncbi:class I SAM-dependent methyltransferase [Candidatus Woesearchaeota archaeon]|nr:class I SAM-dependent methyltransferase [Candidatus Woesearchaeota archaeon]
MEDQSSLVHQLYAKIARIYTERFHSPSEFLNEFMTLAKPNCLILDVGCGPGIDSNLLHKRGYRVIGIDFSEDMIAFAKQHFPDIDFRIGDMRKLSFPNGHFDGIIAAYSLIHISKKDIPTVLKSFSRILKVGGIAYIAVQEGESQEGFFVEPLKPDEKMFLNIVTIDEISQLLSDAGFEILKTHTKSRHQKGEFPFKKLFILAKKS